jgi:hypothetical protein
MTKRTRLVAGAVGAGALALGGLVAKRVLNHGGDDNDGASPDPIAETPTAPPGAEEKPVPKPKPAKPVKPVKPKADKPKLAKPKAKADKPKPAKPKAAAKPNAKPPKPKPTKPKDPHHELNNPVVDDPDLTEYPDPYDTREDPLDQLHPPTGAKSTSEPPLSQDPELENGGKPPRRDNLDD